MDLHLVYLDSKTVCIFGKAEKDIKTTSDEPAVWRNNIPRTVSETAVDEWLPLHFELWSNLRAAVPVVELNKIHHEKKRVLNTRREVTWRAAAGAHVVFENIPSIHECVHTKEVYGNANEINKRLLLLLQK